LADVLLRQPVIATPTVARELRVTPQHALLAVTPQVNAGILEEFTGFARNRRWHDREVLDTVDDFAAQAGRWGAWGGRDFEPELGWSAEGIPLRMIGLLQATGSSAGARSAVPALGPARPVAEQGHCRCCRTQSGYD
jgi:hypothetical protein